MVKMKDQSNSETVREFARSWWKSLMANTVALVEDAALLASHKSPVRAQSLIVHALEELAKARCCTRKPSISGAPSGLIWT